MNYAVIRIYHNIVRCVIERLSTIVTCGAPRVPNERGRDTYMKVGHEYDKFNYS